MDQGRVVQQGTPQELFERPAHTFAGYFIGSPGMNLLSCSVEEGAAIVDGQRVALDPSLCGRARALRTTLLLGIRPEFVQRVPAGTASALHAEVTEVEDLGRHVLITARLGEQTLKVKLPEGSAISAGEACSLSFPPTWTMLYADGRAVS
jgi:glycerol transport system ATP-binding protein